MAVTWSATFAEALIYLLCVATSLLCAYLLASAFGRRRSRLLIWSAACFTCMAMNNLVLAADVLLLPNIDLTILSLGTSLAAVGILLFGFIWEEE
jgi:hypothetical protein